jgi:hypothetical protein
MATNPTGTEGSSAVLTATDLDLIVSVVELLKVEKNKSPSRMIPAKLEVTLSAEDLLLLSQVLSATATAPAAPTAPATSSATPVSKPSKAKKRK